jgi:pyruvate/2-oxoglutarate dehydrogenase complex dihydrolipoamide acyltransferase (E2) component
VTPSLRLCPRLFGACLAVFVTVAGCSSAAAPDSANPPASLAWLATAEPTAARPATPSPVPTPTPTPSATPTAEPDPVEDAGWDVQIGAPYKLVDNPANGALKASFSVDVAGQHIEAAMSGREIRRSSAMVGAALKVEFTGMSMTRQVFEASAKGGATSSGGRLSYTTILGKRVAMITTSQTTVGMYVLHGFILMVAGVKASDTKTLLTSVIKAN